MAKVLFYVVMGLFLAVSVWWAAWVWDSMDGELSTDGNIALTLGISDKMDQMRGRVSQAQYNGLSVRLELQADCLAGVWANQAENARQILENGDVEAAMNAAAKIGDDALQRSQGGAVVPESFTHGTSAQRQRWFSTGLRSGSLQSCDTFNAKAL